MRTILALVALLSAPFAFAIIPDGGDIFMRGDANSSGVVDVADASMISSWLYNGGDEPPCLNQADVNDDGQVTVADVSFLTNWLYQGGPPPPFPGPNGTGYCEEDSTPRPGCAVSPCP